MVRCPTNVLTILPFYPNAGTIMIIEELKWMRPECVAIECRVDWMKIRYTIKCSHHVLSLSERNAHECNKSDSFSRLHGGLCAVMSGEIRTNRATNDRRLDFGICFHCALCFSDVMFAWIRNVEMWENPKDIFSSIYALRKQRTIIIYRVCIWALMRSTKSLPNGARTQIYRKSLKFSVHAAHNSFSRLCIQQ